MRDIKDLILKMTGIKDPNEDKQIISDTIKSHCGFSIVHKNIDLAGEIIKLNISGPEKNAIFMMQGKIIKDLQEKIKDRKIIRIV